MVHGVTGLLGGGKSYSCVEMMVHHLRRGGIVCTNIELDLEKIQDLYKCLIFPEQYYYIDVDEKPNCWEWPRGDPRAEGARRVMIVIDEAGEWFSYSKKQSERFADWLRQTDKQGQDVFLIVQDASILCKQGRVLCHRWIKVRNMSEWRIPALGWPLPPPWRYEFHRFWFDSTGKQKLDHVITMRDKKVFQCYRTAALFGSSAKSATAFNAYEKLEGLQRPESSVNEKPLFVVACIFQVVNFAVFYVFR